MAQSAQHPLEIEFGLSAREVLDVIQRRNRCHINVRGAVAEYHLGRILAQYQQEKVISELREFDQDGRPDFAITYNDKVFLVECKNVEKARSSTSPITVDFQRTRNPIGQPQLRFYTPDEFHILAACLWNRTQHWQFAYVATRDLPRHPRFPDRISNRVLLTMERGAIGRPWSTDLREVLITLSS